LLFFVVVAVNCPYSSFFFQAMWAAIFGCLRGRVALLHGCLPPEGYLVVVFTSTLDELVSRGHIWLIRYG
jgi:hypothetical protein